MLTLVSNTLNARTVRPLTDQVSVLAPTVKSYNVTLTYYIDSDDATSAVAIQAAVQSAVSEFVAWQKEHLGRDINPTELYYRVRAAGAKRAVITEPVFAAVAASEVAIENTITVNFGGLEDG
ncbi:baseplate J/gp47 family protein [Selenomonas sp. AB3002]